MTFAKSECMSNIKGTFADICYPDRVFQNYN